VVYPYDEILLSLKNEDAAMCDDMEEPNTA
jgi:hypothetical protein